MHRNEKISLCWLIILMALACGSAFARPPIDDSAAIVGFNRQPELAIQRQLDARFLRWETFDLDTMKIQRQVIQNGRVELDLGDRVFNLELEPADVRTSGFKSVLMTARGPVVEPSRPVATYKGRVAGDPESSVRLLVLPGRFEGYIRSREGWLFIDSLARHTGNPRASGVVVYDNDSVREEARANCGSGEISGMIEGLRSLSDAAKGPFVQKSFAHPFRRAELAIETDYEYYQRYGDYAGYYVQQSVNRANGILERELFLTLQLTSTFYWTTADDPYTSEDTPHLLTEFINRWNSQMGYVQRDLAGLISGKGLDSGQANSYGSVCSATRSYFVIPDLNGSAQGDNVFAHEVSHLFGSLHDEDYGLGAQCPPASMVSSYIMCSVAASAANTPYSSASKNAIFNYVNLHHGCLDTLESTIFTTQTPASVIDATPGYEVATVFEISQGGRVTGLRFYRAPGEQGTNTLKLWNEVGTLMRQATYSGGGSGWVQVDLLSPIRIYPGNHYRVSVNTNTMQVKTFCGLSSPITNGPLTATGGYWGSPAGDSPKPPAAATSSSTSSSGVTKIKAHKARARRDLPTGSLHLG